MAEERKPTAEKPETVSSESKPPSVPTWAQEAKPKQPTESKPETKPPMTDSSDKPKPEQPSALAQEAAKPEVTTQKPPEEHEQLTPCQAAGMKAFNRWSTVDVKLTDPGMAKYINLNCMAVPRTGGKYGSGRWTKDKMPIIERFMNRLQNAGHRGKKHKLSSGNHAGKIQMLYSTLKKSFILIEKKTNKNPIQVLVEAVENAGPLEEVASYRLGGIIARNSVVTSPQRRLDLALRYLTQGIYRTSFRNKKSLVEVIAEELIAASARDTRCFAIMERNRLEKEAEGAR